ncbi:hypothetical protein [Streptomyces daliensis]|uniref:DNA primase/polymerase bifunctional N-terminal domain-containing protein n=1 Tax=Streptomyces daliensis TaxID=299421 RepID=A0A8T4IUN9_9ACTN|nr:hypothetical protein [Streptomyces daliensis]
MDVVTPPAAGLRVRPAWLPLDDELAGVDAGVWWDAIAIDGDLGGAVAGRLKAGAGPCGPIAVATRSATPRWYFLAPLGTAETWTEPGTQALGDGCRIGLPGSTTATAHPVRWDVPPRFCAVPPLNDSARLATAVAAARAPGHVS